MTLHSPELARICREYALLLHSGIGMADGAFLMEQEEQPPLKTVLKELGEHLDMGMTLSDALKECGCFPEHVCAMVGIGEETGRLEDSLNSLADYYEERSHTLRQIRSAVAYPAMVLMLMLVVVGVLLIKVLPVFDRVYASLGSRLTGPAAGLLYAGQLLENALPVLFGILLALAAGAAVLRFCPVYRQKLVAAWQHRYGDRGIARKFNNARFARALAMGLASGLQLETCMTLAGNLLQDVPDAAQRCADCARKMEEGMDFTGAMEQTELMMPGHCRLLQIGTRGGNADRVMERIADEAMEDAQNALEQVISSVEPAMVMVSSLLVGLILLSVLLPLADILTVLG